MSLVLAWKSIKSELGVLKSANGQLADDKAALQKALEAANRQIADLTAGTVTVLNPDDQAAEMEMEAEAAAFDAAQQPPAAVAVAAKK